MDLVKTKDGKFVLCHDIHLERITGQKCDAHEINYSEIQPVLDNIFIPYDNSNSGVINKDKLKPALF